MAATEVKLPKLGMSMTEATILDWLIEAGGSVSEGEELFEIETDKADTAIESPATGTLEILVEAGETVEVGTVIARITP
jgi:pyruvate/2-oxoglutarate dehydrogenase complex dihydrolipoamide acyltransferase (E2) component